MEHVGSGRGWFAVAPILAVLSLLVAGMPATAKPPASDDESFYYSPGIAESLVHSAPGGSEEDPWIVLWSPGRLQHSLHLAHFSRSGEFLGERLFDVTPGWPEGQAVWRDGQGRIWIIALGTRDLRTVQVYAADGRRLAEAPVRNGKLIGLTRDAEAVLVFDDEVEGPRVRLVDPFSGRQSVAISWLSREEFGPFEEGCLDVSRSVLRTDAGSFYLVRRAYGEGVARRYTRSGVPAESLRVPAWNGSYEVASTRGEWLFTASSGHVDRWSADGHHLGWPLEDEAKDMVGRADGGAYVLLSPGRRLVVFEPGGEVAGPFALEPPPAGMTWAERAVLRHHVGVVPQSGPQSWAAYLSTAAAAGGEPWNRARRLALSSSAEATDGAIAAAEQWCWVGPPSDLLRDLLDLDPAGVGDVITRHLEATAGDGNDVSVEVLASLLVAHWRRPSPRFAILLQDHASDDSNLGSWAKRAYAEPQHGMAPAERFPAPASLVEHHLADLAEPSGDGPGTDSARFFLAQIEHAGAGLEARLADTEEPAQSNARAVILAFPDLIAARDEADYGPALRFLASRAATWAASPNPGLREAGRLLSVALGDGTAATWLIDRADQDQSLLKPAATALELLGRHHPASREPVLAEAVVLHLLANPSKQLLSVCLPPFAAGASSDLLASMIAHLSDPTLSAESFDALAQALLGDAVWPRVPLSSLVGLVEAGFAVTADSSDTRFRLLDALWRRLESRPDLRRRLEDGYAALFGPALDLSDLRTTPFFTPLTITPESGLARRVPDAVLERFVQGLPSRANINLLLLQFRKLAALAAVRGRWPALEEYVERTLRENPPLLWYLPPEEADQLLSETAVFHLGLGRP